MNEQTNQTVTQFDDLLANNGPAALVVREHLTPVEGADAVLFPATYAEIGYNIDWEQYDKDRDGKQLRTGSGRNICLIDSVGSQANRIEPMFKDEPYASLVPQVIITAGAKSINLLDAGHRAGDAIVRCSGLQQELQSAFRTVLSGNALPLAKIAPTSLVFGVWDSRDTHAKLPRLIASTVRAYNVRKLTRSAQYWAGASADPESIYDDPAILGPISDKDQKDRRSAAGFTHVPSTGEHGGVIADGGVRRDAVLALSALKLLRADTKEDTLKLQRYILGLALVAFTKLPLAYYRQGTILTLVFGKPREFKQVALDGTRNDCGITHEVALKFAQIAAQAFGVGKNITIAFDVEKAKADLKSGDDKKAKKAAKGKKAEETNDEPSSEA